MKLLNETIGWFKNVMFLTPPLPSEGVDANVQNTIPPPSIFAIMITSECNLRCKQCFMWQNKEHEFLTLQEKISLIEQYHLLNPHGTVSLTGGEPLLKEEEFFTLSRLCRTLNLTSSVVTNASLINESNYERLLLEGPDILCVSLESHIESVHDYVRGVKGTWKHVTTVLRDLAELRKTKFPDSKTRIVTSSILFDKNISLCKDFIEYTKELGIDGVSFRCLLKTFVNETKGEIKDAFFQRNFFKDQESAVQMIDELIQMKKTDGFLLDKIEDYQWIKAYIKQGGKHSLGKPICASHWNMIIVKHDGEYELCPSRHLIPSIAPLGSTRDMSLLDFWTSTSAKNARDIMDQCELSCGMLQFNRRENAVLES